MDWIKLTCGCLVMSLTISAWPQSAVLPDEHATKVRIEVQKRGVGERAWVKVTLRDKTVVKGYVSQIGSDSFEVSDKKSGRVTTIGYQEVDRVQKQGLSTGAKVAIGASVVAGAMIGAGLIAYKASGY